MYTSVMMLALSGCFVQAALVPEQPKWLSDYGLAWKQGQREGKPLAVVLGSGQAGWNQLSQDGELNKEAVRMLRDNYVCVYLNTKEEADRELAASLKLNGGSGIVISDRTVEHQAFRHQGGMPAAELKQVLQKYADPDHVVRATETLTQAQAAPASHYRQSYYPPANAAPVYAPPMGGFVPFGGFGGGRSGGC